MENIPVRVSSSQAESRPGEQDNRENKSKKKPGKSKRALLIPLVILLILVGAAGVWYWQSRQNASSYIDTSKYQALFLSNGQVYFGKLSTLDGNYFKLTDIYYLQTSATNTTTSQNPQDSANSTNDVKLIKLGSEVHGPEDQMIVSKEQVLFFENLKKDGRVTQSINQYQSKK